MESGVRFAEKLAWLVEANAEGGAVVQEMMFCCNFSESAFLSKQFIDMM